MWILSIIFVGLPMAYIFFKDNSHCSGSYIKNVGLSKAILYNIPMVLGTFVLYVFCSSFGIIICEIVFFSPFAFFFWSVAHSRYTYETRSVVGKKAFDFILDNKSVFTNTSDTTTDATNDAANDDKQVPGTPNEIKVLNNIRQQEIMSAQAKYNQTVAKHSNYIYLMKKHESNSIDKKITFSTQERLFRVIFVNYCFIKVFKYAKNKPFVIWMDDDENIDNEWANITLRKLRQKLCWTRSYHTIWERCKEPFIEEPKNRKEELKDTIEFRDADWYCFKVLRDAFLLFYCCFMLYIFFPLFLISRIFSMCFPLISIIYFRFNIESIELLQWLLTICYVIFIFAWIIAVVRCLDYYHWTMHVLPYYSWGAFHYGSSKEEINYQLNRLNIMQKFYFMRLDEKFLYSKRKQVVIEILGKDIGGLIVSFWPKFDMKQWLDQLCKECKELDDCNEYVYESRHAIYELENEQ